MNADKAYRRKARWELHKNAMSHTEEILEATLTKQQLHGHLPSIS